MTRREQGFTLVEVVIALTIVATLLVIAFAGLRVGLASWQRGEERAQILERSRSVNQVVTRALAGAYPYQTAAVGREAARLLFEGEPDRVGFATAVPPFPGAPAIAFTAVSLSLAAAPAPGLALTQKALPNDKPFDPTLAPVFVDGSVSRIRFRYLREANGEWIDRWDASVERSLPRSIEVTLTIVQAGRSVEQPPLIVPVPVTTS
ncbi:MAG TPA: prepilin-type N-terminal cleavage/methylation domain-containing protein [Candidatus Bathyarchaeia archaeon]|nr:prepilin-type N-terminal cleavage/methylation domain-containing protein [Candidatus Bathyarchaeia archaeon]